MGWIKNRILAEKRKHSRLGDEEWSKIAEAKIKLQIREWFLEVHNKTGIHMCPPFLSDND